MIALGGVLCLAIGALLLVNRRATYEKLLPGGNRPISFGEAVGICAQESAIRLDWSHDVIVTVKSSDPNHMAIWLTEWPKDVEKMNDAPLPPPDMEFVFHHGKVSVMDHTLQQLIDRLRHPLPNTNALLAKAIARAFRDRPAPCEQFTLSADPGSDIYVFLSRMPFMPGGHTTYQVSKDLKTVTIHPGAYAPPE